MPSADYRQNGSGDAEETDALALAAIATLQQQLDETEIIARSDTLQPGETIPDAGTQFDAAGRRWETLNDNAVVPDPLTVAALEASPDFGEPTVGHPFGDAQVSVRALDVFADREVIQQTGGDFGIYTNRFHLSDDPAVVGSLQGATISFENGVPKDLYLVGPTVRGPGETIDREHNGTITGIHYRVTFDGQAFDYEFIDSQRNHPTTLSEDAYLQVAWNDQVGLQNFDVNYTPFDGSTFVPEILFSGLTISTPPNHPDAGYALHSAEAPFLQNPSGSGSILFEEFTETFTPHASGEYTFTYSASEIVRLGGPTNGTAGVSIGTTLGASDIFDSTATLATPPRLNTDTLEVEVTITLEEGVEYFFTGFAGGGSEVTGLKFCIAEKGLSDYLQSELSPIDQLNCLPQTTLTPAAEWTLTGGVAATGDNLIIGGGGLQDGVAEFDYVVPVGNRNTRHIFSFDLREVDAAGNDIALRVEVEQAGSVFVSRDVLTTEVAQNITLDFVPTADVVVRIRDTSTGSQGSNRDALVSAMQVEATCKVSQLASTCFAITPADSALTSPNVFDWNVNQVNDIRATAFYITQDPSSSTPLTQLVVPLGETVEFIIVGPLYSSDTVFGNIGGVRLNATNTDGVLSFEHIEQRFTPAVATWPNTTYDDLNQSNATVGEFRQASADFLFTDVPVNLSQVASDVKGLMSSPDVTSTLQKTNPAARLEITNNTLQSELSLTLGALGISVDGVAIMPLTSADYTQGGITAVTADSTNWTRASTGNRPTDTNVGFENVPQGRYRYTFSIPEQEDGSTVDANDVADNDRPFPVILVNGVPVKLHADNTYIEHDDGSTSEYHSSGTIVVPEGGSVQLGLVIEGGDTEEFEFQNAVITTEQGVDAIYGFFEIEKIDRPVVAPAVNEVSQQLAALQNRFDINDIVLTTIPDLQFDVKAGEKWVFEVNLLAESLDATADLRAGTIAPAGSTGRITFVNAENAVVRGADINAATLSLAVAVGTDDLLQIKGIVNAGEDGVVQFQLRNNTGTNPQSFKADSWVEAKKIS